MLIQVEFEEDGKSYTYKCPIKVTEGDIVLVNVYGNIKAARVIGQDQYTNGYCGPIKTIVGLGLLLEDPRLNPESTQQSLLDKCYNMLRKIGI